MKEGPEVQAALDNLRAELVLALEVLLAMRPRLLAANVA
jgi:hypothetical protein